MSTLYIGTYNVAFTGYHSYLIHDQDGNPNTFFDQSIIRSGPTNRVTPISDPGTILVEAGDTSAVSVDGLNNFNPAPPDFIYTENDKNEDGNPDTLAERNYHEIASGILADTLWNDMLAFASELLGMPTVYNFAGPNSNSTISSVLNAAGLNFRDSSVLHPNFDPIDYPGHMGLLDGSGDNNLTAFIYDSGTVTETTIFRKYSGNDTILLEWNNATDEHAQLQVINEFDNTGLTTVYFDGLNFADVGITTDGDDLKFTLGPNPLNDDLVRITDFYINRGNDAAEGAQTSAFEFIDTYLRLGDDQDNVLDAINIEKNALLKGFEGDDELKGSNYDDILEGGPGNDTLYGYLGTDTFIPGIGNDTIIDTYGDLGLDTLVLDHLTDGIQIQMYGGTYSGSPTSGSQGTFSGVEHFILGAGNDTVLDNSNSLPTIEASLVFDAKAGFDTLEIGSLQDNNLVIEANKLYGRYHEYLNFEHFIGGQYTVLDLGHSYESGSLDYSNFGTSLTFDLINGTITDGVNTDITSSYYFDLVGTNFGDTITMREDATLWTGTGDDFITVNVEAGTTDGHVIYTGGHDIITGTYTNDLRVEFYHPITANDLSFNESVNSQSNNGDFTIVQYDLVTTINGYGTLTLEGQNKTVHRGADDIYGTADDTLTLLNASNLYLADGTQYGQGNNGIEVTGSSGWNLNYIYGVGTQFDDTLTARGSGRGGNDLLLAGGSGGFGNDTILNGTGDNWGDGGDDYLSGSSGNEHLYGGYGNDELHGLAGNDTLIGNAGLDKAVYSGNFSNYSITSNSSYFIITDNVGQDGTDTVKNDVEILEFADGTYENGVFTSFPPSGPINPVHIEAEDMTLIGDYTIGNNAAAPSGQVAEILIPDGTGTIQTAFTGGSGSYNLTISYFDEMDAAPTYEFYQNGVLVESWIADEQLGSFYPLAQTYTSHTINDLTINTGDILALSSTRIAGEQNEVDDFYFEPTALPLPDPVYIEAEDMTLSGDYTIGNNASAPSGQVAEILVPDGVGTIQTVFSGESSTYDLTISYFDEMDAEPTYELYVNSLLVDSWIADEQLGSFYPIAQTYTSHTIEGLTLNSGDLISLSSTRIAGEQNEVDQFAFIPQGSMQVQAVPAPLYYEAENLTLDTYQKGPNSASSDGYAAWLFGSSGTTGTISTEFEGEDGLYDLSVSYFDEDGSAAQLELRVNGTAVESWLADEATGSTVADAQSLTQYTIEGLNLTEDDVVELWAEKPILSDSVYVDTFTFMPGDIDNIAGTNNGQTLNGTTANEALYGLGGDDTLYGDSGDDLLYGGNGLDVLWGEAGADIFIFEEITAFNQVDVIKDFNLTESDVLDVSGLLIGYDPVQSSIDDFVFLTENGSDTTVAIDRDGSNSVHTAENITIFEGLTGLDVDELLTNGHLITV